MNDMAARRTITHTRARIPFWQIGDDDLHRVDGLHRDNKQTEGGAEVIGRERRHLSIQSVQRGHIQRAAVLAGRPEQVSSCVCVCVRLRLAAGGWRRRRRSSWRPLFTADGRRTPPPPPATRRIDKFISKRRSREHGRRLGAHDRVRSARTGGQQFPSLLVAPLLSVRNCCGRRAPT